ncbi:hypothetical protein [Martelella mangrovi]|uniref:Single-stranded DNA-binding protein BPT7 domain-containing protein n=1 Tax=Martelella mangrovi TaxID=1397477 RepID=A0ABV2IE23_9HYPH
MAKARRAPTFLTPAVTFIYPKLNEPDTKYKEEGEFSVKAVLTRDEAAPFIEELRPVYEAAEAEARERLGEMKPAQVKKLEAKGITFSMNPLFSPVYDEEGDETGEVEFKFTMKASGVVRKGPKAGQPWSRRPALFDAKGAPLRSSVAIWGGTVGKVAFTPSPYFVDGTLTGGLALRLSAVQVIDLVSGGQRSAAGFGFSKEEGGYEQPEEAPEDEDAKEEQVDSGNNAPEEEDDF